jgi:hypothetical protein
MQSKLEFIKTTIIMTIKELIQLSFLLSILPIVTEGLHIMIKKLYIFISLLWSLFILTNNIMTEKFCVLWSRFFASSAATGAGSGALSRRAGHLAKNRISRRRNPLLISVFYVIIDGISLLRYLLFSSITAMFNFAIEKIDLLRSALFTVFHSIIEKISPIDEFHSMLILVIPLYLIAIMITILILRKNTPDKAKQNTRFIDSDSTSTSSIFSDEERVGVLKASRNCYGNLVIRELNFVIDEVDKKTVIGKEDKNGKIVDLTKKDIDFCDRKGLRHM